MASYHSIGSETVLRDWANAADLLCTYVLPSAEKGPDLIGKETEFFVVDRINLRPINHETYRKLLTEVAVRLPDLVPVYERQQSTGKDILIGLKGVGADDGSTVCDEPGCQVEWAGGPRLNLHQVAGEEDRFLKTLQDVAEARGLALAPVGLFPLGRGAHIPLSERARCQALQGRIRAVKSGRGHDLSRGTCSSQINLNATRKNWKELIQAGLGLQPFVTALFANSPFFDGKPTGNQNERAVVWNEWGEVTRQTRELIFSPDFSVKTFVDFVSHQELPLLARSAARGGDIELPKGTTFRDLLAASETNPALAARVGEVTAGDFVNALNTLYAQIKIKAHGVVELRAADSSVPLRHAVAALSVGLLYDAQNLAKLHKLVTGWTEADHEKLASVAPRQGLDGSFVDHLGREVSLRGISRLLCAWAHEGLVRRGLGEESYLKPVSDVAEGRALTPSAEALAEVEAGASADDVFRGQLWRPARALASQRPAAKASGKSFAPDAYVGG